MSPNPQTAHHQPQLRMCKTKMATDAAQPTPRSQRPHHPSSSASASASASSLSHHRSNPSESQRTPPPKPAFGGGEASTSNTSTSGGGGAYTSGSSFKLSSGAASISSRTSLSSLRETLPENPHIYDFKEICSATNNFLAKRYNSSSSSSQSWRCVLRGKEVIVFQRKFRRKMSTPELRERLSVICRSHHTSVINLLGASVSGDHLYLVYDFIHGANLADCLRNPRNPDFTVLSNWSSRMQIATDIAHGLDYIHNKTGLAINFVHNRIKSSSIIVTEGPGSTFNARICHFGSAQLCGEIDDKPPAPKGEISEVSEDPELDQSESGQLEGVMGYMSPEFRATGVATRESDVYAFGVVVLELVSGVEPVKYRFDKRRREFVKTSVVETAAAAVDPGGGGGEGRLRQWVDARLRDSYPVEVAERLTRVALECVHGDPEKRPNMGRVAGKISKLYLESRTWSDNLRVPTEISVSLAPR